MLAGLMGDSDPESWALRPDVQRLLAAMLAAPCADHAKEAAALLDGGALLEAHVASVFRHVVEPHTPSVFEASFTSDSGVAMHTILFHLLGGGRSDRIDARGDAVVPASAEGVESAQEIFLRRALQSQGQG